MSQGKSETQSPRFDLEGLTLALQGSVAGFWDYNAADGSITFSDRWKTMLGYEPSELPDSVHVWKSLIHPDDYERTMTAVAGFLKSDATEHTIEYRLLCKDRGFRWIMATAVGKRDEKGRVVRVAGWHLDIHSQRRAIEELIENTNVMNTILDHLPVALLCKDVKDDFRFFLWNKKATEILGVHASQAIGKRACEFLPQRLADNCNARDEEVLRKNTPVRVMEELPSPITNKSIWMQTTEVPVFDVNNEPRFVLCISEDITERRESEKAIQDEKSKLEMITANIGDVIWMTDLGSKDLSFVSPAYEKVWERSCDSLMSDPDSYYEAIVPEDRARVIQAASKRSLGTFCEIYRIVTPTGFQKWILDRAFPIENENGEVTGIVGVATDITIDRRREEQIKEQKERFELIINNIPLLIGSFDDRHRPEWVNREWTRLLGWDGHLLRLESYMAEMFPETASRSAAEAALFGGHGSWSEIETTGSSGQRIPINWASTRLSNGKTIAIGIDVSLRHTQQRIIEEQQLKIISSAKMSSLGEMAAGIAHEINNPLAIIHGRANQVRELIESETVDKTAVAAGLTRIERTAERIAKIVRGLRSFSRSADQDPFTITKMSQVLQDTLELCRERFKNHGVNLEVGVIPDCDIECRSVQISQVLLNLLNNAYDAVTGTPGSWVKVDAQQKSGFIQVAVTDSGTGIPPMLAAKIMEPFFTTKEVGHGTGLGLSISKGIIDDHGGSLKYDANSANTRFVILLPLRQLSSAGSNRSA